MKMKSKWVLMISLATLMLTSACQPINAPSIPVSQIPTEAVDDALYLVRDNGLYGYVNSKGEIVIKPQFEFAYDFSENLAMIRDNEKLAYIDRSGNIVLQTDYVAGESFQEGLAVVVKDGYGFINKNVKTIVEPQYDYALGFSEGMAVVTKDGKSGFIDKTGKLVIEMKYDNAGSFKEGLAKVSIGSKNYYINPNGEITLTVDAEMVYDFSEGMALIRKNEKYGFIDNKGQIIVQPIYEEARGYSEGLAAVSLNERWGYIDKKGDMIIAPQYKSDSQFKEGLAPVLEGRDWQYIDKKGIAIIKDKFTFGYNFSNGIAVAQIDGESVLINTKGEILWHETDSVPINGGMEQLGNIIKKRIRSDKYDMIMAYPYIEIKNKDIENNINEIIKKHFNIDYEGQENETFDGDYDIKLNKNSILSIVSKGYTYSGGAHGMSYWRGISLDLNKGISYKLEELFKKDSGYKQKLNEMIKKEIRTKDLPLLRDFEGIYKEQEYYLTEKGIVIYYQLYDYTPYAYGFLQFEIPYDDVKDIINLEGPLGGIFN